jgi:dTDP-4-amino-4,6-dideoxygalactose transaminase
MIPFNKPPFTGNEVKHVKKAMRSAKMCGNGDYTLKVHQWFENNLPCKKALLTPSCTHALEMAAILIDTRAGDEIIMPSYTFVSTANAFVLRGAKIVFVDVRPDTMNIDEKKIEAAITDKTKAIVPVHYAGVACEMDTIMTIAKKYELFVIEDAAQGLIANYKDRALGTIGHFGAFSFHDTKNYTSGGEGGLLVINDDEYIIRAEIIREKGTNRSLFFRGMVDKYSWVDIGSSYLPGEIQAAYLFGQLEMVEEIRNARLKIWNIYKNGLSKLVDLGKIKLQYIPEDCDHPAHMFYIKVKDIEERTALMSFLNERNVQTAFHYVPLHSSDAGRKYAIYNGEDRYTTKESERLLRLPMWYGLDKKMADIVVSSIYKFYGL